MIIYCLQIALMVMLHSENINRVDTEPGKSGKPGKQAFFTKSQGKPGLVRELFILFIQVREKSGKTKYLVNLSFPLTNGRHDVGMELLA